MMNQLGKLTKDELKIFLVKIRRLIISRIGCLSSKVSFLPVRSRIARVVTIK